MKKIVIESLISCEKTAILEDDKLVELLIDDKKKENRVSNIYRGIVKKKILGIQACFVDIGFDKLSYLQIPKNIDIKNGSEILVQVNKEEVGEKGCKLNLEISISGRYLVYIPSNDKIVFSNKINSENDKERLKNILNELKINSSFIVRTEAINATIEEIEKDIFELKEKYQEILREYKLGVGPKLLYKNLNKSLKYIKDNINDNFDEIIVNNKEKYCEIKGLLENINKDYIKKIKLEENTDVFDYYKVSPQIKKAINKKVWLKSGGYIIIEKTEALTVIDVNSGKFTGNIDLEETIFKTNLEASIEICNQLILRDIGGIIIVDFIDMKSKRHKKEILKTLEENFKLDKRKTEVLGITKLGLFEITRRRERESIDNYFKDSSFDEIISTEFLIDNLEKDVIKTLNHTIYKKIIIEVNSRTRKNLLSNIEYIDKIKKIYNIEIEIIVNEKIYYQDFNVIYNT